MHHGIPTPIGQRGIHQCLRRVHRTNVQREGFGTQSGGDLVQSSLGLRYIEANHLRAITGHRFRNCRAYAPRGPCHQDFLAGQGLGPIDANCTGDRWHSDTHYLRGHVSATRRQQKAQSALELVLGSLGHIDQLHGDRAFQLFGQCTGQTFQGALNGRLARCSTGLRRTPQHHHPPARQHRSRCIMEELVQRVCLFTGLQTGGVKHQRLDFLPGSVFHAPTPRHQARLIGNRGPLWQAAMCHRSGTHGLEALRQRSQQLRSAAASQQYTAFDDRLVGPVALKR